MKKDIGRKVMEFYIQEILTFVLALWEKINKMADFSSLKKYFYQVLLTSYLLVDSNFFQINF